MAQGTFVQALRKEAALSGTFMKGRSLMLNGAVLSIEDSGSRFSKNVTVEGSVRGSRGDLYKTHVALDMDEHEVVDYDCDCPAAFRYSGMCKHAIATALAYLDASGAEPVEGLRTPVRTATVPPAQSKQSAHPAPTASAVNPNFPFPAPVPTSPSLMAALSDLSEARMDELVVMRRKLAGAIDPDAPKAVLEPSLVPYYNPLFGERFSWALEFRIRCGSVSYVVKDIDGMADAYVRGGTFSYGKKLTFAHVPEAFDDVSTKLLDLVTMTVAYLSDITSSRSASYDFARSGFVAERQLPLSEYSIVSVLDLLRGRTISFEPAWSRGTTTHRSYEVAVEPSPQGEDEAPTCRPPLLAAKIAPAAGGSYDLRLPADMYCFASDNVAYLVDTRRARRTDAAFAQHAASFLSRLLPCRTPAHIAADQVGEFCRMALPILRDYTDLTAPAALDAVAPEASFHFEIGVDDGLVTCIITVTYGDWSADLFSLGAPGSPFEERRPGVPPRDEVAEFRVMDTAALYFDFYEGGLAFEERDDESLFHLLTEGLSALSELGEVMLGDRLRQISVRPAPKLSVRATVKSNLLDVELGASGLSAATLPSISIRISATRRSHALRPATSFAWTREPEPRLASPMTWVSMLSTCSTVCRFPRRVPCLSIACLRTRRRSRPIATPRSVVPSSAWTRSARWTLRCPPRSRPRCAAIRSTAISGSARSNTWASAASWPTTWAWAKRSR